MDAEAGVSQAPRSMLALASLGAGETESRVASSGAPSCDGEDDERRFRDTGGRLFGAPTCSARAVCLSGRPISAIEPSRLSAGPLFAAAARFSGD